MAYRPRIGLTMRLELETRRFYLGRDYSDALEAAGAVPVHLPLIADPEYIAAAVGMLDGILLPGADCDPDPALYGEDPHPKLGRVVPDKDATDLLVLAEADSRNLPVLAICYGMQILNVSRGGGLIQDIEAQVENCIKHDQGKPFERNSHGIRIDEGSFLADLAAKEGLADIKVNSHHHQAIRDMGLNLKAVARTSDSVIECVEEVNEERFVLGVQWHPELSWRTDLLSKAIFDRFVERCMDRRHVARKISEVLEVSAAK